MKQRFPDRIHSILGPQSKTLKHIPKHSTAYFQQAQRNCENIIGTLSVPMGIAGPLLVNGQCANGTFTIPLATTEGALVASINRGCKAITQSSGAIVDVQKVGISRAPVFRMESAAAGKNAQEWFKKNLVLLQKETCNTSNHLKLLKVETALKKNYFFSKFWFDAQDAMGMNMATIACEHLVKVIEQKTKLKCIALSGNWCADKKPAAIHLTQGRGFSASAEVELNTKIIQKTLKTTPEKIIEVYESKIKIGSKLASSLGANAHYANIIAALFLATGQDLAHVVEGAHGITHLEMVGTGRDLSLQVYLPGIVCGVIGGGTHLPKQQEALQLLGIELDEKHPGRANQKFAEIIAASVLAGELSLLAALSSQDLAKAHSKARTRK